MERMYLSYHIYDYGEHNEYEEIKILGICSSEQEASKAIELAANAKSDKWMTEWEIIYTVRTWLWYNKSSYKFKWWYL